MKVRTGVFHRWMALFLCIVMFASMLPVSSAFAEEETEVTVDATETVTVDGVEGAPAETNEAIESESNTEPVAVIIKSTPEAAKVTIYQKNASAELEKIEIGPDGYYLLMPGTYYYSAECENYVAQEAVEFVVQTPVVNNTSEGSETGNAMAVQVSVTLTEVVTESETTETASVESAAEAGNTDTEEIAATTVPVEETGNVEAQGAPAETEEETSIEVTAPEETVKVEAKSGYSLSNPVLRSVVKSGSGLKITWEPVTGGNKYRVFRKTGGSSWQKRGDVTGVTFTDTGVTNGTEYIYTVRCISNDGSTYTSSFDATGIKATYWNASTPKVNTPKIVDGGIQVTWSGPGGTYTVFRKEPGGSWVKLGNTTGTSFTDKQVVSGKTYIYTIRVVSGNAWQSAYETPGKSATYYSKVSVSGLENVFDSATSQSGVKVAWNGVPGVNRYRIERKLHSEDWNTASIKVYYTVNATSLIDYDVSSDNYYSYRVKSVDEARNTIGLYDANGKSIRFYEAPQLEKGLNNATITKNGVTINWRAVKGVNVYRVFRKIPGGIWNKLADVKNATTYTDKTAAAGTSQYIYTVRCVNDAGTAFISGFDPDGIKTGYTNYPILVRTGIDKDSALVEGISVTWKKVEGAEYYQIYRKTDDSNWVTIEKAYGPFSTDEITYLDKDATGYIGTEFTYTVRCVSDASGASYISAYDETGIKGTYYPTPKSLKAESVAGGIQLSWEDVHTAPMYQIYRRVYGSGAVFEEIGRTTDTNYLDNDEKLTAGIRYEYAVVVLDWKGAVSSMAPDKQDAAKLANAYYYGPPTLVAIEVVTTGIKISWYPEADITNYRIYRKTVNQNWTLLTTDPGIKEGDVLTYIDKEVTNGTEYSYTVSCEKGSVEVSKYDPVGLKIVFYGYNEDAGGIKNGWAMKWAENKTDGILVSWNAMDKAVKYEVYRREKNTTFEAYVKIGESNTTTYLDKAVKNNNNAAYHYTVKGVFADGSTSDYAVELDAFTRHSSPVLKGLSVKAPIPAPSTGETVLSWIPVEGVTYYNIYRKQGNGNWTRIATKVSGSSFTDTPPKSGVNYSYRVCCADATGNSVSDYYDGLTTMFLMTPDLLPPVRSGSGYTVRWKSVDGAEGYRIYRKMESGGGWSLVKTVSGYTTLTWTDNSVLSGYDYYYTVRAVKGSAIGGHRSPGINTKAAGVTLTAPTLTSAGNTASGVELKWSAVSGATSYTVFRKLDGGNWSTIASGVTGTSYTDSSATSGTRYIYCVRAEGPGGPSANSNSKEIVFYSAPVLISATIQSSTSEKGSVLVKWQKVSGAPKYRVFRKTGSGSWTKLTDTTATSYTDNNANVNTKYTYTVRCINNSGNYISGYDSTGKSVTVPYKLTNPTITSVSAAPGAVTVKWNAVGGASNYRVFRKLGTGSWVKLGDTSSLSFVDKTAKSGNTYTYTVRCINSAGTMYTSNYDSGTSVKAK